MRRGLTVTFTELIYGVVIGTAVTGVTGLELSAQMGMILLALAVVFDDYLLYHFEVQGIAASGRNFIKMFVLDLVVLAAWYALYLSAADRPDLYWALLAFFFVTTSIWAMAFSSSGERLQACLPELWFILIAVCLYVDSACSMILGAEWQILFFAAFFAVLRLRDWKRIWAREDLLVRSEGG